MNTTVESGRCSGSARLVSLDIDHALLHTFGAVVPAWREAMPIVIEALGISEAEAFARMGKVLARHLAHDNPWWIASAFASIWKGSVSEFVEQVERPFWDAQDRYLETHLQAYPDVVPTLSKFKDHGVKMVCVSDATFYIALARLHKTGLSQYIDGVYALDVIREPQAVPSEEWLAFGDERVRKFEEEYSKHFAWTRKLPAQWAKPKPYGIWLACADFGVQPRKVYHAGDSLAKDVLLGANAGLKGALWLPDHAVATLPLEDVQWINEKFVDTTVPSAVPVEIACELQGTLSDLVDLVLES